MTKTIKLFLIPFLFDLTKSCAQEISAADSPSYGVDVSWPIHASRVSTNYPWLLHNVDPANNPVPPDYEGTIIQNLGDRQSIYENYMQGCRDYYGDDEKVCDEQEGFRLEMNLKQTRAMVNYTNVGYKKIRAPDDMIKLLKDFWEKNRGREYTEEWFDGSVAANYWEVPTDMLPVEDDELEGGGKELKGAIWKLAEDTIREWTNMDISATSVYGVRIYKEGSILSHHVDRLPLISSAIINVAQDVDEDWPIEVIGHDGVARNITMEPGDMILYESHSIVHGRPFALKGRYYANIFVHFEPVINSESENMQNSDENMPFYIVPDSNGKEFWKVWNGDSEDLDSEDKDSEDLDSENIDSEDSKSEDQESEDIEAENIDSEDIDSEDIDSEDQESEDTDSEDQESEDIDSEDIDSEDIDSEDIEAEDKDSEDIESENIGYEHLDSEDIEAEDEEFLDSGNQDQVCDSD